NIDKRPGTVRIESVEQAGGDRLVVRARAEDSLSGVFSAMCNGRPTVPANGLIVCEVPVRDGLTDVIVSMLDRAGNSASGGRQHARKATDQILRVFPASRTIRVGDTASARLVDNAWQPLESATWTSDNPAIATVETTRGVVQGRQV